jgi:hypothetical protein
MRRHPRAAWLCAIALLLTMKTPARAQSLLYSVEDLGTGQFQYGLIIDNRGGLEPIAGLSVLNGGSVFDLNPASPIGAPPGWDFFAPDPLLGVDSLDYFSVLPPTDVPLNAVLAGFTFESSKDPATFSGGDFTVELISRATGKPVFRGVAQPVPEPASLTLVGAGAFALLGGRLRFRRRAGTAAARPARAAAPPPPLLPTAA